MKDITLLPEIKKVKKDSFIGLRVKENKLYFYVPQTYRLENDDLNKINKIKKIIRTISVASNSSQFNSLYTKNDIELESNIPLLSYLYIIADYINHGKYRNFEKVIKKENKGKINWKKTIKQIPYVSDGLPIYPNFYTEHNSQYDAIIVDVYKHCLKKAIGVWGWLFGIKEDEYMKATLYDYNETLFLQAIKIELSQTYNDKKRKRLITMREIILGLNIDDDKDLKIYGVNRYWPIYEFMLRNVFAHVSEENIRKLYPKTDWYILPNEHMPNSVLRPDIIYQKSENHFLLIDAKYYQYSISYEKKDIPKSTDIIKQFVYSDNIKKLMGKESKVYNCFVMPFNKEHEKHNCEDKQNIKYFGYATSTNNIDDKIIGIYIDLTYLIDIYSKKFSKKEADELYNLVKNQLTR